MSPARQLGKLGATGSFWRGSRVALLGLMLAMVAPSSAAVAAWCAVYQNGGRNCGFTSQRQCLANISGIGGTCYPSGEDQAPVRVRPERPKKNVAKPKPAQRKTAVPAAAPAIPAPPPAAAPAGVVPPAAAVPMPNTGPNFASARQLVLAGQYEAGLAALRALNFDDHPDVAAYVGLAHRKLDRLDEAKAWYERALAADPNHRLALSFYGMMLAETGDLAGAQSRLARIGQLCGNTDCNEYRALQSVIGSATR